MTNWRTNQPAVRVTSVYLPRCQLGEVVQLGVFLVLVEDGRGGRKGGREEEMKEAREKEGKKEG
jgi:hypothetical protein